MDSAHPNRAASLDLLAAQLGFEFVSVAQDLLIFRMDSLLAGLTVLPLVCHFQSIERFANNFLLFSYLIKIKQIKSCCLLDTPPDWAHTRAKS